MFRNLLLLKEKVNIHYAKRYIAFIESRKGIQVQYKTQFHHILPKSKDMFPEYKDLNVYKWNGIYLTHREHFIAHRLLHKMFKGSSQTAAFFNMSNIQGNKKSKSYQEAKEHQIESLREITQRPERNAKISKKLKGVPKTQEHKDKLKGPRTQEEKDAISAGVLAAGFKFSDEQRLQMSIRRKGIAPKIGEAGIRKMTESKMKFILKTPMGIFLTYEDANVAFGTNIASIFNREGSLDYVPKNKLSVRILGIKNTEFKTWKELGFDKIEK
jgi:hypothetical protein